MIRLEVDYNSRDDAGFVPAPAGDAGPIRVGDLVETYDDEGNRALAVVESVAAEHVSLAPMWPTFVAPDEPRLVVITPATITVRWGNPLTLHLALRRLVSPPGTTSGAEALPNVTVAGGVLSR